MELSKKREKLLERIGLIKAQHDQIMTNKKRLKEGRAVKGSGAIGNPLGSQRSGIDGDKDSDLGEKEENDLKQKDLDPKMDTGLLIKGREEVKEQKSPISPFKKRASQENLAVAKDDIFDDEDLDDELISKQQKDMFRLKKKLRASRDKSNNIYHNIKPLFDGLDQQFKALTSEMKQKKVDQLKEKKIKNSLNIFEDVVVRLADIEKLPHEIRKNPNMIKLMRRLVAKQKHGTALSN